MTEQHLDHTLFGGPADDERGGHGPRRSRAARRRPRRRKPLRRFLVLVIALAIVGGASYAAYTVLRPVVADLTESKDYPGPGAGEVQVVVNDGDTGTAIAATLEKAGVVKTRKAYLDAATRDAEKAAAIQPGTYTLKRQMAAADALAILVDSANRTVPRVTVREGLWAPEVFAALSQGTGVPVGDYAKAAKDPQNLGLPAAAKGNVEGYLFPSTYEFPAKSTAAEQLRTMVAKAVAELERVGIEPARMERTMVVASIIEGEVSGDADRGKVARVIENRLAAGQMLQMDSTVHYAVQKRGKAGTTDADRRSGSPYNTYRVTGLPPAPINSPGAASIEAAASPEAGPWRYFVTVDPATGETRFATTFQEHQANVNLFNKWCTDHPGKC